MFVLNLNTLFKLIIADVAVTNRYNFFTWTFFILVFQRILPRGSGNFELCKIVFMP